MRLCSFGEDRLGLVAGERVHDVTGLLRPAGHAQPLLALAEQLRGATPEAWRHCPVHPIDGLALRSPVRRPGKILAAPDNYRAHAAEMAAAAGAAGRPVKPLEEAGLFLKATSSLVGPSEGVAVRRLDRRTDHEVELVAVIGRAGTDISHEAALSHVAGYCLGLDITMRGPEDRGFRKSLDSYAVVGPWMVTADEIPDPQDVALSLQVNGVTRQSSSTSDMINDVAALIAYASRHLTLHPGDLVFTGTPEGVGPIRPGDVLRAEASGIGAMEVAVRAHQAG